MVSRRNRRTWLRLRPEYKTLLDDLVALYVDLTGAASNSGVIEMALAALGERHGLHLSTSDQGSNK